MEFSSAMVDNDITLTPAATEVMRKLFDDVEDDDITAIRLFVSGGGCSGMTYGMTFTGDKFDNDKIYDADGFNVYIDSVAFNYLQGVEIDYAENGMNGASFVFNNVFASTGGSGSCGGCGGASGGGCS
ncbi:MAG: iron-sulfur cluster assembly accessory protein [Sulfuriflexus sp.]|nr:iron-sulfur cluster assembly accessory protein [Sulfuriflexus sp.]